jgi:O-antigen ligase
VVLASLSLFARRDELEWRGLLPISLLVFVIWSGLSVFWAHFQWSTLGGVLYQLAFAVLGLYVSLGRDLIQIIRAFGDVLRAALAASVALEIVAGVLIDGPIGFLGIRGLLTSGGPLQGIFESGNQLGFISLIAIVTFGIELATKSVTRQTGILSLLLAAVAVVFTRSPVTIGTLAAVALATAALAALRRASPTGRRIGEVTLMAGVIVVGVIGFVVRSPLVTVFSAGTEVEYRLEVWRQLLGLVALHPLEGWGWIGLWRLDQLPYTALAAMGSAAPGSALNAYLDVWLQTGLVGLVAFIVLLGLCFVRSWLIAASKKSVVNLWPALVMLALIVVSLAESFVLVEFGWLIVVVCAAQASAKLSWRSAWDATARPMS